MSKSQPTYAREFKQQAVQLFETSGKNKTQRLILTFGEQRLFAAKNRERDEAEN